MTERTDLPRPPRAPGELFVVGLGPGDAGSLTADALAALRASEVIAGYSGYLAMVDPALLAGKERIATGMRGEVARCEQAIAAVRSGKTVCLVSSGDPGVYAMAGLVLEILCAQSLSLAEVPVTITPGVPAVCSAAALLGAPLTHDFACVSLSDLLTPPDIIERRLHGAFAADFVVALYNPRSRQRPGHLARALRIAREYRKDATPVGHVRNAYRPGQEVRLAALAEFNPEEADMLSLIVVGNTTTRFLPAKGGNFTDWADGARMVTPRGYGGKYSLKEDPMPEYRVTQGDT